jgi:hypothetical protein
VDQAPRWPCLEWLAVCSGQCNYECSKIESGIGFIGLIAFISAKPKIGMNNTINFKSLRNINGKKKTETLDQRNYKPSPN